MVLVTGKVFKSSKQVIGFSKLAKMRTQIPKAAKVISHVPSNPLQGANYTRKVLRQMENNLKTGKPDFHRFPRTFTPYFLVDL